MICRECKKEIKDGSKFCKHCGRNVENDSEISFCTSCGKQIKNNSLFCKHCGASVGSVKKDDKGRKTSYVQKIIIIALVLAVGLLAFGYYKNAKPEVPVVGVGNNGGSNGGNNGGSNGGSNP